MAVRPTLDVFASLPDPSVLLSADGEKLAANPAFDAVFRHAITPRRPPWGRLAPPPFDDSGLRCFEARAPDGRLLEWRERRLEDGSRVAVARDISERAAAADETARAKSLLFATLTHELRTPLNGILGMAGLLEGADLDASHREYLKAIRMSGEHLLDLVNEILDFSRLESGRLDLEETVFEPEGLAQGVAELLGPRAREKSLEIVVQPQADAPLAVRGDEGRTRQILFNLVGNAVKFTASGGVAIEIAPGAAGTLRYTVRDTGPGIPLQKQSEIFEAFVQADASHSRLYGGAGLGLAIVRRLTTAMGGRVGLSSRPGQGSAFWVELPAPAAADLPLPPPRLDGVHVGVRIDNPVLARGVAHMITTLGGVATMIGTVGNSGRAAVALVDEGAQHQLDPAAIPIILLVAQENRQSAEAQRETGGHYLLKPLRRGSLATRILAAADRPEAVRAERLAKDDERAVRAGPLGLAVLLAEDNPINALLARTLLQRSGCRVDVVADGEEAVRAAQDNRYDLIFLDLRMPRLDGVAAARRIKGLAGDAAQTPIVALTADAGEPELAAALAAGMEDVVTKPISAERLAQVAARFTKGSRVRSGRTASREA